MAGLVVAWTPNMPSLPVLLREDQNSELWSPADAPHYTRTHQETSDPIRLENLTINRCQNLNPFWLWCEWPQATIPPRIVFVVTEMALTHTRSLVYILDVLIFQHFLCPSLSRLLSLFSLSRLLSLFLSVSFALSFSLTLCVASMASMASEHCFFCKAEIAEFITGWPLKDGSFAKLCGKCG